MKTHRITPRTFQTTSNSKILLTFLKPVSHSQVVYCVCQIIEYFKIHFQVLDVGKIVKITV